MIEKKYKIFDVRGSLLQDDIIVLAKSPMEAVKKYYDNVRRNYKNGDIVVNNRYMYDGDKKK